jgi:Malectin domain
MFQTICRRNVLLVFLALPCAAQVRIACGLPAGTTSITDSAGDIWTSDAALVSGGPSYSYAVPTHSSPNPLYQNLRFGSLPFSLKIPVPAGLYTLTLKFIDPTVTVAGGRVFTVTANGMPVLYNFDIVATAGAGLTAYDISAPITITGTSLLLTFSTLSRSAVISAVDIEPLNLTGLIGPGLLASVVSGQTVISLDTAFALDRAMDEAGVDHGLIAVSNPAGVTYAATMLPTLSTYTQNQFFAFVPDVTNLANATLNLDGLGPVALMKLSGGAVVPVTGGECVGAVSSSKVPAAACLLLATGSPVSAFLVFSSGN